MKITSLVLLLSLLAGPVTADSPNLLILAIDTLRADHLGCYGYERRTSPVIDGIARRGVLFERAIATAPWTLPSFASIFTGLYPTRHGAALDGTVRNLATDVPHGLSPAVKPLAEILQSAGYRTGAVASNPYLWLGLQRGFDDFRCKTWNAPRIGAMSRQWIARQDDRTPFFLLVHFNDPHEPTDPPDVMLDALGIEPQVKTDPFRAGLERWGREDEGSFLGRLESRAAAQPLLRTKLALYDASIREVDLEIDRILSQLEHQGLLKNTVVVVLSDHGEEFWDHGEMGRDHGQDPRRVWGIGHGHTLYDELLRVPFIIQGPGVPVGQRVVEPISMVDFTPTILSMLGVGNRPEGLDGVDRTSWLGLRERPTPKIGFESIAYGLDLVGWQNDRFKIVADRVGDVQAVFDLSADPRELDALVWDDADSTLAALRDELVAWSDSLRSQAPTPLAIEDLTPEMREGLRALGYVE